MVDNDKRIRIITGNYGSGKTEFAVNYSVKLREHSKRVAIADLDIVNVYFRSREKTEELEKMGIEVISSSIAEDNCDMPAISSRVITPMINKDFDYIIDLGGSEAGVNVLGRFKPYLNADEVDFFMVVNVFRPGTCNIESIIEQKEILERTSGMAITGYVNNSNLIRLTDTGDIEYGENIIKEVSRLTNIPIKYTTMMTDRIKKAPENISGELFPMKYYMRATWM